MQSRLLALVASGHLDLPSPEDMASTAAADAAEWRRRYFRDSDRVPAIVDFQLFCDDLAHLCGSLPPLRKLALANPRVCLKLWASAFSAHQYRFAGPFPDPKGASAVYLLRPIGNILESVVTGSSLMLAWALSFVFPTYKPNFGE